MSLTILSNISAPKATPPNLRNPASFKTWKVHAMYNGIETLSRFRPKIWSLVPPEIRQSVSPSDFKSKTKKMNSI